MERFDQEFLEMLEDTILTQLPDILPYALEAVNDSGRLRELMELLYLDRLLPQSFKSEALPTGKILVFSGQRVRVKDLLGVAKNLGVSKERFEFYNYEQSKTYPYYRLEYSSLVSAILFGEVPHKTVGVEDFDSIIKKLEYKEREGVVYARVLRLNANNELKLTKTNFRAALIRLISEGSVKMA